jgi:cytochrome c553
MEWFENDSRLATMKHKLSKASAYAMLAAFTAAAFTPALAQAASETVDELIHNALQLDVNPARGGEIFRKHCAGCHGPKALGDPARDIPSLAGQRQAYIVKQLADFSQRERDSRDMHRVVSQADVADPQVWADVSAYVNALPPIPSPQRGDGRYVQLGEGIFREQCAACHEEDARGDDDGFVPSLRNQHYAYLLNEMRTMGRWHTRNVDEELSRFLDSLDEDELTGLADYLSRQHGPTKDRLRMRDDGAVVD